MAHTLKQVGRQTHGAAQPFSINSLQTSVYLLRPRTGAGGSGHTDG